MKGVLVSWTFFANFFFFVYLSVSPSFLHSFLSLFYKITVLVKQPVLANLKDPAVILILTFYRVALVKKFPFCKFFCTWYSDICQKAACFVAGFCLLEAYSFIINFIIIIIMFAIIYIYIYMPVEIYQTTFLISLRQRFRCSKIYRRCKSYLGFTVHYLSIVEIRMKCRYLSLTFICWFYRDLSNNLFSTFDQSSVENLSKLQTLWVEKQT